MKDVLTSGEGISIIVLESFSARPLVWTNLGAIYIQSTSDTETATSHTIKLSSNLKGTKSKKLATRELAA
jgi:hypothetical protein